MHGRPEGVGIGAQDSSMGARAVVLDGARTHAENKSAAQKKSFNYEEALCLMYIGRRD